MKSILAKLAIMLAAVALLYGNQVSLSRAQAELQLNRVIDNPEIPPSLAITTFALGPLRALIVDALWWRAMEQQDLGEYFDALQLTYWITQLQPTFASVWAYQGWNMAFNIAYDFARPEDRWLWIERAIELLRDEGLRYNPDSILIRHELARIYYDRIGGTGDVGAEYFKNQWAFKMMTYFNDGSRDELERLLAAAPDHEVLLQQPEVRAYVGAAAAIGVDALAPAAIGGPGISLAVDLDQQVRDKAAAAIYVAEQRRRIEQELHLDLERMLAVDRRYGPLDWRLHQAHAIYWAAEDDLAAMGATGVDYTNVIRQSMMSSFYEGRLFYDQRRNTITRTNNLAIVPNVHDYVHYLLESDDPAARSAAHHVHKRFLEEAIAVLYTYNLTESAQTVFAHYKEDYLKDQQIDFGTFIVRALQGTFNSGDRETRRAMIESTLYQSFLWTDIGEFSRANGYFNLARLLWRRHQASAAAHDAKKLPAFEVMVDIAQNQFVNDSHLDPMVFAERIQTARSAPPPDPFVEAEPEAAHDHDH